MSDNIQISGKALDAIIQAEVQAAVASALMHNSESMIKALVQEAFIDKEDRYGSKDTKFATMIKNAIREEGRAAFHDWLGKIRPQIKEEFERQLATSGPKKIFDAWVESMSNQSVHMSLNMTFQEVD